MVGWNAVQSVVENIPNIRALNRIVCIRSSVRFVHIHSRHVDVIRVDAFESGSFEADAEAANSAEQLDECGCHGPRGS